MLKDHGGALNGLLRTFLQPCSLWQPTLIKREKVDIRNWYKHPVLRIELAAFAELSCADFAQGRHVFWPNRSTGCGKCVGSSGGDITDCFLFTKDRFTAFSGTVPG